MKLLFCVLGASITAQVASCGATTTFVTPSNATFGSLPVAFEATIITDVNSVTVTLDAFTSNPTADTQTISGLQFVLNFADPNTPAFSSETGQLITIASNGIWSNTSGSIDHWEVKGVAGSSSTTVSLDVFSGGTPHDLIIGDPAGDNKYDSANNSVTGNSHQPWVHNSATFVVSMLGITANTQITSATFNVGTTASQSVSAILAAPEPGSFLLMSLAVVPFGVYLRKRRA